MNAFERLKEIIQALNDEKVDYVLFGGQAVNLHGILRFTEDIESETLAVGDVRARVATPRMLYRMKRQTIRPIDRADALDLKAKFGIEDE